jgi:hypothetical protein
VENLPGHVALRARAAKSAGQIVQDENHMTAYMVVTLDVHDPSWVKEYMEKVPDIYEGYGGKRIVSAGPVSVVESDAPPGSKNG